MVSKTLKHLPFLLFLVLFIGTTTQAQTTVNSLTALLPYLDDDNANVKVAPGTYTITANDINQGNFGNPLFYFEGSNSTYDFTGVTINIETAVFKSFGKVDVKEIQIVGNNNVLKNLTMVDDGETTDNPSKTALGIAMDGSHNRIEGFHMTVKGSWPYGYGDAFGKGGGSVIFHYKHSAILVRGESNHVKNTTIIHRSYGHAIFMQAANNALIEGCYIEGEVRSTDDMLAEEGTGTRADDVDFMTVWGYKLPAGFMMSLQEEGIRAYNGGETVIDGVTYNRGTSNPTVLNCTVVNMRGGVTLTHATGTKYVEGCTTLGCERGYAIGSGDIVNCSSDAKYGPAFGVDYSSDKNMNIDITILSNEGAYNGDKTVAYIGGSGHNITFRSSETNFDQDFKIMVSGDLNDLRHQNNANSGQDNLTSSNIELNNETGYPIILASASSNISGESCGPVTDNGSDNSLEHVSCVCEDLPSIQEPESMASGINYRYYEGEWNTLPNFDELTPVTIGTTSHINLDHRQQEDYFGFVFEGYIDIIASGKHTFYTNSDDGSRLYIDDQLVVDNDGAHAATEKSGDICLEAGFHSIKIEFFEKTGGNVLEINYSGPSHNKSTIGNIFSEPIVVNHTLPYNENTIGAYPNPFHNHLIVSLPPSMEATIKVFNALGQSVLTSEQVQGSIELDFHEQPRGIYILKVSENHTTSSFSIQKD